MIVRPNLKFIRQTRINKGYTMKHMCELLGYGYPVSYYRIESGKNGMTFETFSKICEALDVNPLDALEIEDRKEVSING